MTPSKLNTFIRITVVLACLAFSYNGHSQADTSSQAPKPLEVEYQQELDKWMLQAYEGDRDAQFKVGVLFTNDQFQSADLEQSVYWYKQAARQGHALSQYNLGHQYLTGSGVKRNEAEAMKWWLKAAEQDHPLAQFNIGRAYYLGIGLREDHAQSRLWFERAARNNEPKSIDILKQLNWSEPGEYENSVASTAPEIETSKPIPTTDATKPLTESPVQTTQEAVTEDANKKTNEANDDLLAKPTIDTPRPVKPVQQQTTQKEARQNQSQVNRSNPIAVYTNPAKRSVLITILNDRKQLRVVKSSPEWTEVTNQDGFPVWVHQNYIVVADDIGSIQGNEVNARSVPLITSGTIVGQLNDNETLTVVDKKNAWYRVVSPSRFKAWVKTDEYNRTMRANAPAQATNAVKQTSSSTQPGAPLTNNASINDNDWLFSQPANGYTLQLASFDDRAKVAAFTSREKFINNPNLHSFTSRSKDMLWTYFLYGEFTSSDSAKQARIEINQKLAWVRSFGKLQQNRCIAWKKQIPAPKELNKYCS